MHSPTKDELIASFDPDGVGQNNGNLFGLPFSYEHSRVAILPVPWDVTVSYNEGSANGPAAILEASPQLDFYDPDDSEAWKIGFHLLPISREWRQLSEQFRVKSVEYISFLENGGAVENDSAMLEVLNEVNEACKVLHQRVKERALDLMKEGKMVALLGGDHSTPLGLIQALSEKHSDFGILHIDAHLDLRRAYEGFTYSHASIMYNVLQLPQVERLVSVGIRDYCRQEAELANDSERRVRVYYDADMKKDLYEGVTWQAICEDIVAHLPQEVYVSVDIDGLDPKLCPNTGTPVPGGLEFEQVVYLLRTLVGSGRKIIGFDLNEVSPGDNDWDANVGARMLWKLCVFLSQSNNLKP
ncbi:MAG: agmatinase family protein [Flavobacteriales bacterium]